MIPSSGCYHSPIHVIVIDRNINAYDIDGTFDHPDGFKKSHNAF